MRSFVLSYRLSVFFRHVTCAIIASDRWWYIRHLRCAIFQTVATNLNLLRADALNPQKKMNPKTLFFLLGLLLIIHSVIQTIEGHHSQRKQNGRKRNEVSQGSCQAPFFPLSLWSSCWQLIPEIVQTNWRTEFVCFCFLFFLLLHFLAVQTSRKKTCIVCPSSRAGLQQRVGRRRFLVHFTARLRCNWYPSLLHLD